MKKILICGLGSIGKRHARLINEGGYPFELFALRSFKGQEKNDLGVQELTSWEEVDQHQFDIAFVTNPTNLHIEYSTECVKRGMHLFLEKPIDSSLEGLDELIQMAEEKKLATFVAYPFRFHPILLELKKRLEGEKVLHSRAVCASYMPSWRSKQNYKKNYTSFKDQGGGVILDVSHELDTVDFLFGPVSDIQGSHGRKSELTIDSEDYADMLISHAQGTTNLHLNFFSRDVQRYIEVDTENALFRADLKNNTLSVVGENAETVPFELDRDEVYRRQLEYFFDHYENPPLMNQIKDAAPLFQKMLAFRNNCGVTEVSV